ncbi:MAG: hypothetical protein WAO20_19200 [Acidobacteriota bacterium]
MNLSESRRVVKEYGEALKRASAEVGLNPLFPDESLPFPKDVIKGSIREVYTLAEDYPERSFLLDAYVKLAAFVPARQVEQVANWLKGGITGDQELERNHHAGAVSILSFCLKEMERLRQELLEIRPASPDPGP